MLDLGFVRDNLPLIEEKLRQRGADPNAVLGSFKALDTERRRLITEAESLKAQQNRATEEIGKLRKSGQDAIAQQSELRAMKEKIKAAEEQATERDAELRKILQTIPNVPHESVPVGASAEQNVEVRRWGKPPDFSFAPKPHWELGEQLGVLDFERAAKITGARFAVYWDLGAKLERALANFMLDVHTSEHGYTEVLTPFMVNSDSMYGTGQLPKFEQEEISLNVFWLGSQTSMS